MNERKKERKKERKEERKKERKEGKPWGFQPDLHKTTCSTTEDGLVEA